MSTANFKVESVTLIGTHVELVPLEKKHRTELLKAAADGELWNLWYTSVPSEDSVDDYIEAAILQREAKSQLPFVVIEKSSGRVVGCTRFCNIDHTNTRLEIGYTFYAQSVQRSAVNSETKLLLLTYAFESLGCIAVEFRTNWFNYASRNAIARLGAKQDGVLRNHVIMPDGSYRDTVVFSILNTEWSGVKTNLKFKLSQHAS
ncbi:GNAT family N-acetyltransferase [Aliikangiella marina]|uniref:GNAT family N-acetyltransferase n=1 Tax=Aliikangiella marina TaxID=1712262 RepID=A0A545TIW4_9GAMM|nr:GNAT family protein [Aliikangiella marina]TQV77153.1 GNAT family N-acetyltransferase [Aliikangiella marina]